MLTIICDTREQTPFVFSDKVRVIRGTLPLGDYSLPGFEHDISIERKSLSDLMGSMTHDRARFTRELKSLRHYRFSALVIEGYWEELIAGKYRSRMHPNAALASLMSFVIKFGIMPVMAGDRTTAAAVCENLLVQYANSIQHCIKKLEAAMAA